MRFVFNGTVRDKAGVAVESATVTVYEADTTTPATIYSAKSGGSPISGAELTTTSAGAYTFYVDDSDYLSGSQFDIEIDKDGTTTTLYDEATH